MKLTKWEHIQQETYIAVAASLPTIGCISLQFKPFLWSVLWQNMIIPFRQVNMSILCIGFGPFMLQINQNVILVPPEE